MRTVDLSVLCELMFFTKKKLPLEKAADLIPFQLSPDDDYRILGSPVYLLMQRNGKLVSIKEPLDFFTPDERERVAAHSRQLLISPLAIEAAQFVRKGQGIREILSWLKEGEGPQLEPAPYEVSYSLRMKLNEAWSKFTRESEILFGIESFFIPFFVEGACGPLSREMSVTTRNQNFAQYELALLQSAVHVFFLLHLSLMEEEVLQTIRRESFLLAYDGRIPDSGHWTPEVKALLQWVREKFPDAESRLLTNEDLHLCTAVSLQKVSSRVKNFNDTSLGEAVSIHGVNGFLETVDLVGVKDSEVTRTLSKEFLEVKRVA